VTHTERRHTDSGNVRRASADFYNESLLEAGIVKREVQQLMAAYLVPRLDQISAAVDEYDGEEDRRALGAHENLIGKLGRVIQRRDLRELESADVYAALAYRAGMFGLAEKLAAMSDAPLAYWVRGKLALRRGQAEQAALHYALTLRKLPAEVNFWPESEFVRAKSEESLLALLPE
jgi:hypothetical protein